jgi:AraC-like DNA-binding protein
MRIRKRDAKELIRRVKEYLAQGSPARAGLKEIARAVDVSPSYLAQAFRAIEQMPVYRYALHLRLQRAASLLPDHDNLVRLALELGFASHSHFSTAFLRWAGCTPSVYRARMRQQRSRAELSGDARIPPNDLWRLTKCPQKGAAHAFAVSESGLPGHDVNGQLPLFHQDPRGLDA